METNLDNQVKSLREKAFRLLRIYSNPSINTTKFKITMPDGFEKEFFNLIDKVNFSLMEETDNFFGYFLFQMDREVSFRISSPAATNFKGANYVIYFNPLIFLNLNLEQMKSVIKHEILHILSLHLIRARALKDEYSKTIINMAMDIVVNKYLNHLPAYATTLEGVNETYSLSLKPYATFEYYAEKLKNVTALQDKKKEKDKNKSESIQEEFDNEYTHDIWEESSDMDEKTLGQFTEKIAQASKKGEIPTYLEGLLSSLQNRSSELPWNLYLSRLMGTLESSKKKTVTRRNRRQPDRLDLRGELRSHKLKIIVAIDISGSISTEEFKNAMIELLGIVKSQGHEITVVECDDAVRGVYKIKSEKDLRDRSSTGGSTKFTPVFEYANQNPINLLIYFTDGKGEKRLKVKPKGYKVLWVISGKGEELSVKEPFGQVKKLNNIKIEDSILDINDVERGGYSMNNQEKI